MIGTTCSGISDQLRDMYSICNVIQLKKKLHPKVMTLEILLEFPIGYRQRGVFYITCWVSSEVICLVDVPSKCFYVHLYTGSKCTDYSTNNSTYLIFQIKVIDNITYIPVN